MATPGHVRPGTRLLMFGTDSEQYNRFTEGYGVPWCGYPYPDWSRVATDWDVLVVPLAQGTTWTVGSALGLFERGGAEPCCGRVRSGRETQGC